MVLPRVACGWVSLMDLIIITHDEVRYRNHHPQWRFQSIITTYINTSKVFDVVPYIINVNEYVKEVMMGRGVRRHGTRRQRSGDPPPQFDQ